LLEILGADERQAISTDGVGFLIAAPLQNDCVVPTTVYLPVHVFYPTEQKGPVRLLLHAEFLVKSDRTALMPVDGNPFNAWVADRLAYHVCKFVNDSYRAKAPSTHAALLVPFGDRASHPVAENLWRRIADKALCELRLADVEARQRLTVREARLISVSVCADLARGLLEATSVRERLLHPAFDEDKEARRALKELGCKEINDQGLMEAIAENAHSLAADTQRVWACWEWLAAWVAKEPYGEEHRKRIEHVRALPVVPIDGSLVKALDLAARIVTWKPDAGVGNLPDWLPLTFVEDWFRDRIQPGTQQDSSAKKLCAELGITEPGADVIQRAVGRAIEEYWKHNHGNPARFLRFIMESNWQETCAPAPGISKCPVPVTDAEKKTGWCEARCACFGQDWGNDALAVLYGKMKGVKWVKHHRSIGSREKLRKTLEWLGCPCFPLVVTRSGETNVSTSALPQECAAWRSAHYGHTDFREATLDGITRLNLVSISRLGRRRAATLLILLARHWAEYYLTRSRATLSWFYYTWRSRSIPAYWWHQVQTELAPPVRPRGPAVALNCCWLPDKRAERAIGDLLPVVDLHAFGSDRDSVREWLVNVVGVRTQMGQLTVEEWKRLLSTRIPDKASAERLGTDERLRDKVTGWYAACLDTVAEQENVPQKGFASCPLLCRRGDIWKYVADEPRYLDDDNDLATAYAKDVWLFHIPARLAADAVKYLGVLPLSQSVGVEVTPEEPQSPLSDALLARFNDSLPYVWAWRSSQSKQAADSSSARLKALKVLVVPALKANLSLAGVRHEVERGWYVTDNTMFLHEGHVNEAALAQALAKALDVRSEADFYENLLRCTSEAQRKEKLLSKGIADAEVERCLRDYSGRPPKEEQEEDPKRPVKGGPEGNTSEAGSAGGGQSQHRTQGSGEQQGEKPEGGSRPPDAREGRLRLKPASTVDYILGGPPEPGGGHSGGAGGGGTGQEGRSLTDAEKAELEKAGRVLAARELERMGFSVEEMPSGNPGFDLRARKNGEELRIEVKAHTGRATVVDVTQRQYKEYLGRDAGGYRWELWNVEHLTENDTGQVVITRYDNIPDDALDARTFRVDLKKCQSPANPSSAAG
jgi:hypothetical protein